jgi:hypothetical protein
VDPSNSDFLKKWTQKGNNLYDVQNFAASDGLHTEHSLHQNTILGFPSPGTFKKGPLNLGMQSFVQYISVPGMGTDWEQFLEISKFLNFSLVINVFCLNKYSHGSKI